MKSIARPVKSFYKAIYLLPNVLGDLYVLRASIQEMWNKGRTILELKHEAMPPTTLLKGMIKHEIVMRTLFVGKRKAKDPTFRHLLRQTHKAEKYRLG